MLPRTLTLTLTPNLHPKPKPSPDAKPNQAREPCGQCYSNAALCALKLEEHGRAC